MDFDFSKTDKPINSLPIALRSVYVLYADPTYDIHKGGLNTKDIVALRTIKGSGNVTIEGIGEITVVQNTLLFFEHQKVRRYYCNSEQWHFWWFEFYGLDINIIPLNKIIHLSIENDEITFFKHCLENLRKDRKPFSQMASALFSAVIQQWLLRCYQNTQYHHPHKADIEKAIDYMKTHLSNRITIKTLAEMSGLSERRFRQVFKDITGIQPKKYFDWLRIQMAEEFLINTSFSIGKISSQLGYSSQFHFCKAFKKAYGISPSSFRNDPYNSIKP